MTRKSLLKLSAGVICGVLVLSGITQLDKVNIHAKERIEVEVNQDVQVKVIEKKEGAVLVLKALKDIENIDIKVVLDSKKTIVFHLDKLAAGQIEQKEISIEQFENIKKNRVLPNTEVVRKSLKKNTIVHGTAFRVNVSYDINENSESSKQVAQNESEEVREKAILDYLVLMSSKKPVLDTLTFKFVNKKHPKELVEITSKDGMLKPTELHTNEEYTVSIIDNNKYLFNTIDVILKKEEGYSILYNAKTGHIIDHLDLKRNSNVNNQTNDKASLDRVSAKVVDKNNQVLENVPFRLFEFDGNIPTIVKQPKTSKDGIVAFKSADLKPNKKYELRIEKRDTAFSRDSLVFETDDKGRIISIDNKNVTEKTSDVVEFKEEVKNDQNVKIVKSHFRVVDEKGNPVENVELSVSGIRTKITTLKNSKSNKDGIVSLDLEGKVNGVEYIVNVSKNDQFNWEFKPDSVNVNVSEEGVVTYGKTTSYDTYNYEGKKIPVFVVKKVDLNHLKSDLANKIKEAEEALKISDSKELRNLVASAKEELAKPETLPLYVNGYLKDLEKELSKIKKSTDSTKEKEKETVKIDTISQMVVMNNNQPVLDELEFELVNKKNPKDVTVLKSSQSMLSNIKVKLGEVYTLKVKNNKKYTYQHDIEIRDEDGEAVPFVPGTEEPLFEINIVKK
ncbi:hypothetical protein [Gemella sanguinis]